MLLNFELSRSLLHHMFEILFQARDGKMISPDYTSSLIGLVHFSHYKVNALHPFCYYHVVLRSLKHKSLFEIKNILLHHKIKFSVLIRNYFEFATNYYNTRKHSSRMHAAHLPSIR